MLDTLSSCWEGRLSWFVEHEFMKKQYLEFSFEFGWNIFTQLMAFAQSFLLSIFKMRATEKSQKCNILLLDPSLVCMSNHDRNPCISVRNEFGWSNRKTQPQWLKQVGVKFSYVANGFEDTENVSKDWGSSFFPLYHPECVDFCPHEYKTSWLMDSQASHLSKRVERIKDKGEIQMNVSSYQRIKSFPWLSTL